MGHISGEMRHLKTEWRRELRPGGRETWGRTEDDFIFILIIKSGTSGPSDVPGSCTSPDLCRYQRADGGRLSDGSSPSWVKGTGGGKTKGGDTDGGAGGKGSDIFFKYSIACCCDLIWGSSSWDTRLHLSPILYLPFNWVSPGSSVHVYIKRKEVKKCPENTLFSKILKRQQLGSPNFANKLYIVISWLWQSETRNFCKCFDITQSFPTSFRSDKKHFPYIRRRFLRFFHRASLKSCCRYFKSGGSLLIQRGFSTTRVVICKSGASFPSLQCQIYHEPYIWIPAITGCVKDLWRPGRNHF